MDMVNQQLSRFGIYLERAPLERHLKEYLVIFLPNKNQSALVTKHGSRG